MKYPLIFILSILCFRLQAIVKFDEGRLSIDGVQLLQDRENPNDYYYLPQYPRLAQKPDGSFEISCIKYVGTGGAESNGGIFHALIEFTLPNDVVSAIEGKLKTTLPAARIVGPVPMQEMAKDGENGMASFEVVSSILANKGDKAFTQSFITSGHAPLLPGSRAAIAAKLNQEGATLLWESFKGSTSDVSIAISGYYEAVVKGYNAVIEADASTIYNHFSTLQHEAEGFSKEELRNITDKLIQNKSIKIDVFDRTKALDIKADEMQGIVDLITNKLIELMFDAKTGWAVAPPTEVAVEQGQIPRRQERGWLGRTFGIDAVNDAYVTDHQFVMKTRKDIRINKFYLNLSKSTSIKVPFFTTGNIRGFYNQHQGNEQYFRVVNMDDPDFKKREVVFQVDGDFAQSFGDILNFVSVSFKKSYSNGSPDVTKEIVIKSKDLEKGGDFQSIVYPALGLSGDPLQEYQYRINWSFRGGTAASGSAAPDLQDWRTGRDPAITLKPPFEKKIIEIDAERAQFKEAEIKAAVVKFFVVINGKPTVFRELALRAEDPQNTTKVALYFDPNQPIAYQVNWQSKKGIVTEGGVEELKDSYLYLTPPGK